MSLVDPDGEPLRQPQPQQPLSRLGIPRARYLYPGGRRSGVRTRGNNLIIQVGFLQTLSPLYRGQFGNSRPRLQHRLGQSFAAELVVSDMNKRHVGYPDKTKKHPQIRIEVIEVR